MVLAASHGWVLPVVLMIVVLGVLILLPGRPFVALGDRVRSRRQVVRGEIDDPDAPFRRPDNENDLL